MNFILLFLPIIFGYLTNFFCNYSMIDNKNKIEIIPKIFFIIIWPILYLLIGYIWSKSQGINFWLILLLNIFLCSWLIFNNCFQNKIIALNILIISIINTLLIFIFLKNNLDRLLILPLLIWLIIALVIFV